MKRGSFFIALVVLSNTPLAAQSGTKFVPACQLPFEDIKVHRPIDDVCGEKGTATDPAGEVQNRAKNNFCATGTVADLRLRDFRKLQKEADKIGVWRKPKGKPSPQWRAKLKDIVDGVGEGDVVRFVGFIDKVYPAVSSSGESVNCDVAGEINNDIHLELGETLNPSPCQRLITEISPHYRPDNWSVQQLTYVALARKPIRVTGNLFWDASHSPCGAGEPEQWRATTWEIHPAYQIEVCSSGSINDCRKGGANLWTPLHKWTKAPWKWDTTNEAEIQPDPGS